MKPAKSWICYFSPTGTSRRVAEAVGRGLNCTQTVVCDATHDAVCVAAERGDAAVFAVPVYGGHAAPLALPCGATVRRPWWSCSTAIAPTNMPRASWPISWRRGDSCPWLRPLSSASTPTPRRVGRSLRVGTGETPSTLRFYAQCGFRPAGRIHDFFTRNYDHPIVEEGVLLRDMILLEQPLGTE